MKNIKTKILIIEDEESLADVLKLKLIKEGYEVLVAYDGKIGLDKISQWKPDLILLDIILPSLNGYEILEKKKEKRNKIPVIIISNSGQPVEIERTKELGAVDHLIKAKFEPEEVIEKVRKYLHSHKIVNKIKTLKNMGNNSSTKPREESGVKKLGIKVLLVEDDHFLRDICAKKLTKEGFTVFEVIDGEQALKEIEKIKPNIVLLDIILPAIDGFSVLSKIRSNKDKEISKTPIMMLSNLGQEDDIKKAMDLGADNYLVKAHFTTEEIVDKIKKILKK